MRVAEMTTGMMSQMSNPIPTANAAAASCRGCKAERRRWRRNSTSAAVASTGASAAGIVQAAARRSAATGPIPLFRHRRNAVGGIRIVATNTGIHTHRHAWPCTRNATGPMVPATRATIKPDAPTSAAATQSERVLSVASTIADKPNEKKGRRFTSQSCTDHSCKKRNCERSITIPSHAPSMIGNRCWSQGSLESASARQAATTIPVSATAAAAPVRNARKIRSITPGNAISG